MNSILDLFRTEPTVVIGAIGGFIDAVIVLLVTFGLHISQAQTQAIDGVVLAGGMIVTLFVIRSQVVPVSKANPSPTPAPTTTPQTPPAAPPVA